MASGVTTGLTQDDMQGWRAGADPKSVAPVPGLFLLGVTHSETVHVSSPSQKLTEKESVGLYHSFLLGL